jgi:hypothetical protein
MQQNSTDTEEFEIAMIEMAADSQIRTECEAMQPEFAQCEADGLPED